MSTDEEKTPISPDDAIAPSDEEAQQQMYGFIAEQMQAGFDRPTIAQTLEETGVAKEVAHNITETVTKEISEMVESEQVTPAAIGLASVGGMIAALIGGAVWAGLVIVSGYEVGYVAWGIGVLSGFAVAF